MTNHQHQCQGKAWDAVGIPFSLSGELGLGDAMQELLPFFTVKDQSWGTTSRHTFRGTYNLGAPSKHSFTGLHFHNDCIQLFLSNPGRVEDVPAHRRS